MDDKELHERLRGVRYTAHKKLPEKEIPLEVWLNRGQGDYETKKVTLNELIVELDYWMKVAEKSEGDKLTKDGALQIVALIESEIHSIKEKANG